MEEETEERCGKWIKVSVRFSTHINEGAKVWVMGVKCSFLTCKGSKAME